MWDSVQSVQSVQLVQSVQSVVTTRSWWWYFADDIFCAGKTVKILFFSFFLALITQHSSRITATLSVVQTRKIITQLQYTAHSSSPFSWRSVGYCVWILLFSLGATLSKDIMYVIFAKFDTYFRTSYYCTRKTYFLQRCLAITGQRVALHLK